MKNKIKFLLLTFFIVQGLIGNSQISEETKYNLSFIKAFANDTIIKDGTLVFFKVTPKNKKDFPPVLSMKITHSIGEKANEVVTDVMNQSNNKIKIKIGIYGENIKNDHNKIYELLKDSIDISKPFQIISFVFKGLKVKADEKMYIRYGLWEKKNQDKRIEQDFEFFVEQ